MLEEEVVLKRKKYPKEEDEARRGGKLFQNDEYLDANPRNAFRNPNFASKSAVQMKEK